MEVNGPGSVKGLFPTSSARPVVPVRPTTEARPASPQDAVEISSAGRLLESALESSEVRAERLAQIRSAIEAGTYDTPEKLEAALERMIARMDQGDV